MHTLVTCWAYSRCILVTLWLHSPDLKEQELNWDNLQCNGYALEYVEDERPRPMMFWGNHSDKPNCEVTRMSVTKV